MAYRVKKIERASRGWDALTVFLVIVLVIAIVIDPIASTSLASNSFSGKRPYPRPPDGTETVSPMHGA